MTHRLIPAILICGAFSAHAADKAPKFEVASVKPSAPGSQGCGPTVFSPVQFTLRNCTVRDLVRYAWSLRTFEFSVPADPAWISSARYDINAKSAPVSTIEHWHMLQPLLEDRFRLKWHREKKDLPVYYLSAAKGGLKLPPTVPGSCVPFDHHSPPPPPIPGNPTSCDYLLMPGTPDGLGLAMEGKGIPMATFVGQLTGLLGRPVIDKTGFAGVFDVHLKFARDGSLAIGGRPDQPGQAPDPSGLPNIFTAIRSLGLNIDSGKGPVDVFVIDSAQKPSEN